MCLNRWAVVPGRGIPQGTSASDVLAKLYLDPIDRNLRASGLTCLRYVDDLRVFCKNEVEARHTMVRLARYLRSRGLYMQVSKSTIQTVGEAREQIEAVAVTIKQIRDSYLSELVDRLGGDAAYVSLPEAESLMSDCLDDTPIEVIRTAFDKHFGAFPSGKFDKTLFHFLLKRLGARKDPYALKTCANILVSNPEETSHILAYSAATGGWSDLEPTILELMRFVPLIYPYQMYLIVEWLGTISFTPSTELVNAIRWLAFDQQHPHYLRAVCRDFIGNYGLPHDLELLIHLYPETTGELEQAEIICSLRRLEQGRRNAFLTRLEGDGEFQRRAVKFVRGKGII